MRALELLAPARTAEIGIAAICCGADAVYIGGPAFGARAAACNTVSDIKRLCEFASRYGVRIYVTVNTLCRDLAEKDELVRMMLEMKDIGVAAFIMQDASLPALLRARGQWKEEFHASTQCAIRTPGRAQELAAAGFSRLILERELSLQQIRAIRAAVPDVELEFFVHGALCVCYSGDCYLSEALTGRSANRGECAQPCRSMYDLVDADGKVLCADQALLSLKDYCLIDRLPDLADAGVISFKIEGRLKNEAYVKNVVRAYSEALDSLCRTSHSSYCRSSYGRVAADFVPDLAKTFNRGYTSLFIDGRRGEWHSVAASKGMGEHVGTLVKQGPGYVDIRMHEGVSPLSNGDGLCIVMRDGSVEGFRADKVEPMPSGNNARQKRAAHRLVRVLCSLPQSLARKYQALDGLQLWRNKDTAFEKQLAKETSRTIAVELTLSYAAKVLTVNAEREDGVRIERCYDCSGFESANNRERMMALMSTQLGKSSGIYSFSCAESALTYNGELPLLSSAFLNNIRRECEQAFSAVPVLPLRSSSSNGPVPLKEGHPASKPSASPVHPRRADELMRTKYCIRHRLGMCLRQGAKAEDLFLRNNGKLIPLRFDCRNCEMILGDIQTNQ